MPFPAAAKLRQGEVGGKFPAAVPDHPAAAAHVVRQADGIAGHLAGVLGAVPLADQDPGGRELVEELAFRRRSGGRSADVPPQRYPGRLIPAAPSCLLRLGAARTPGGSAIRGWGRAKPELFLSGATCLPHPVEVVPEARLRAVLAGQGRHDVDVIVSMANCHPSHTGLVTLRCKAGAVHDLGCDARPLDVGQDPVSRCRADRAVPHRFGVSRPSERRQWLRQQPGQAPQIRRTAEAALWLQFGRIAESRNQVRIDVLIRPPRPVEVTEQPASMTPADDFADHWEISQPAN
jgi:hypothetical protein